MPRKSGASSLLGKRFGRWTVVSEPESTSSRLVKVQCSCSCGQVKGVWKYNLLNGRSKGCVRCQKTRHGHTGKGWMSPEYRTWSCMLDRCSRPEHPSYHNYGGRGLKVCKRWLKFENFFADMGPKPSTEHSIDRKNNDRGYTPRNCRWATKREQALNRRKAA